MDLCFQYSETAVLVIDVQRQFCKPGNWAADLPKRIGAFAEAVASKGPFFIYTRSVGDPDRVPENVRRFRQVRGYESDAASDSPEAQLCAMFRPAGSLIFDKACFDAFAYTPLSQCLQERGIKNVLVAGVMTDVCVEATARRAVMEGYDTCIMSDLVAAPEDHSEEARQTLEAFGSYYGYVLKSSQVPWEDRRTRA